MKVLLIALIGWTAAAVELYPFVRPIFTSASHVATVLGAH